MDEKTPDKPKLTAEDAKKIVQGEIAKLRGGERKPELAHEQQKEISSGKKQAQLGAERPPMLKEESKKDLESDLIRLQAEFENYRKRTQKEMEERMDLGKMEFAKSQISFLDEFEAALPHFKGEEKKGMEMLYSNFKKSLSTHGVREMECMGQKYDPYKHDVVLQQESEKPEGTIIAVARKGYFFKDRIVRHAQVVVAKKEKQAETPDPKQETSKGE